VAAHAFDVGRAGIANSLGSGLGQHGEGAAGVVLTAVARDEPVAFEPVDQPRQAAAAEDRRLGRLAHPHPPPGIPSSRSRTS